MICPHCPPPACPDQTIANSEYTTTNPLSGFVGETVTITCSTLYKLNGESEISCQLEGSSGVWTEPMPTCDKTVCDPITVANSVNGEISGIEAAETATITCRTTFELKGEDSTGILTCNEQGIWTPSSLFTCEKIWCSCGIFTSVGLHPEKVDKITLLSTLYKLNGESEISCQLEGSSGVWSETMPTCDKIVCDPITVANSGVHVGSLQALGFTQKKLTKLPYYRFSDNICDPHCPPACPDHTIANSEYTTLNPLSGFVGETVTITCSTLYKLNGESEISCQLEGDSGVWTEPMPTCDKTVCDPITVANSINGDISGIEAASTATITCQTTFELKGEDSSGILTCNEQGSWKPIQPSEQIQLSIVYIQGVHVGSLQALGFTQKKLTKLPYYRFSDNICDPHCPPACPDHTIANSEYTTLNPLSGFVGETVTITCSTLYKLNGESEISCQLEGSSGVWSETMPTCDKIVCDPITVANSINGDISGIEAASTATITCLITFELKGEDSSGILTCNEQGSWKPSNLFTCEKILCADPNIANVATDLNAIEADTTVDLTCDASFGISGQTTLSCSSIGQWTTDTMPTCEEKACPGFSVDDSTNGPWPTSAWGTVATIKCKNHFVVLGSRELTCGDGKEWSSDPKLTSCEQISKYPR
eukprot:sb/3462857/